MNPDRKKIVEILHFIKPYEEITEQTDLISDGILDSMALLIFVTRLEEEYGITVGMEEMIRDNFRSVDAVYELLSKK